MSDPAPASGKRKGPDGLRALDRAVSILFELAASPTGVTLAETARRTGLNLTTAHRIIGALREHRLTRETVDGLQALGPATLILARGFLGGLDFRVEALPVLSELRDETDEACHLATLAAPHVVYVDKLDSTHPLRVMTRIGATAPAVDTALGRAILAYSPPEVRQAVVSASIAQLGREVPELDDVLAATRERGHAVEHEDNQPGVHSLAAPVFDESGAVIAAIDVSIPASRFDEQRATELGELVRRSADRISDALGFSADVPRSSHG